MSITKATNSGLVGTKYNNVSADNYYMEPIASQLLSSTASSVVFNNIPQGYKHLQIRILARTDRSANEYDGSLIQFNSDTGSNYAYHRLIGDGSAALADAYANQTSGNLGTTLGGGAIANAFSPLITDILDYASAVKYKTVRSLSGRQNNTTDSNILFTSSLWMNTSPITLITIKPSAGPNFVANSRFSLYGIRG